MIKVNKLYKIYIYEKYIELKNSEKILDNYDLSKIFEWYSCIYLYKQYKKQFYEYSDIEPTFKEINNMTKYDTGIDCCDLIDTIVQCKLRKDTLDWKECGTFFGSQNIYSEELNKIIVRWNNLIITRNEECKLSKNLLEKSKLFTDIAFPRKDILDYCENLLADPPKYPKQKNQEFILRDYQIEAINLIKTSNQNTIISLPTGCGKNVVIIYSMKKNKKYLFLVPRIILMEQLHDEIIRHKPEQKNNIQCIGDTNYDYNESKNMCICVYNSVSLIEPYFESFTKIYIDEAHHIDKPIIYENDEEIIEDTNNEELLDNDIEDNTEKKLIDDAEDEIKETTGYHNIIKSLSQYNNNVYLSATIDDIKDFTYYKKNIRDMIEQKYLCDYNIHIPIFRDDITNKNICEHMIKNYRNIIIYCNLQKEGKSINTLMNTLQKGCSEYIDCNTTKTKRNSIIKKYKEGNIPFLVNVRILVEGFDAPITKGICFMHLPCSKTTLIQIIGRALRLHPLKTIAHIILPYSCKEDESNINNFLKVMANNDKRIKQSYENKKIGGYISFENTIKDEEENTEFEFRYNMIFDNMCKLLNGEEIWIKRLEDVKQYIDENGKRPSSENKDINIKQLGLWVINQINHYKYKIFGMKNQERYDIWRMVINDIKYKKYFINNKDLWIYKLNTIKQYIDTYNKRPSSEDKDENIKQMGTWICRQLDSYQNKKKKMSQQKRYNIWTNFINDIKYKKYFVTNENTWYNILELLKQFIDKNNCLPSYKNDKVLYKWQSHQKENYNNKYDIMKKQEIYDKWTEFINNNKYSRFFLSYKEKWEQNFNNVKQFLDISKKKPTLYDKDENIKKLGGWIAKQQRNYNKNQDLMSHQELYDKWTEFINNNKYKKYFLSNDKKWTNKLENLKKFIEINKNIPYRTKENKNNEIDKLASWITKQNQNYKNKDHIMKNIEIYDKWSEFINDPKYKKYFKKEDD